MASTVDAMVEIFQEAGTPFLVGHPGGESVELMDAARRRGMRFILVKQESAGAMLAATWGEIAGAPGVCFATRAPGAANMVNGVTHAWMDRCPLIAITDQYPAPIYETGLRQRLNQLQLYSPITKWNGTIRAATVRRQLRRAVRTVMAHPPGPVQLDLPSNETRLEAADLPGEAPVVPDAIVSCPDRASLRPILDRIERARRPIILAGQGVNWDHAAPGVVALAERLGAPVLTTAKAKGIVPEDHPLRAGVLIGGLIEREIVGQADWIITIGLDAVELQPKPWPYTAPVLALASAPGLDAFIPATVELVGPLLPTLKNLAEWAPAREGWGEAAARAFRAELSAALDLPSTGLSPQRAVEVPRAVLPRETIATADSGASRLLVVQKWESYAPREFFTSNGLATMGYALPAGLGARLAYPDRPIVCFTGDGGMLLALAELHTAARENLPIVVVVFDDSEIGLIRVKQEIKGLPRFGITLGGVDWESLAHGLGAEGTVVGDENGLADALPLAVASARPTLIAARVDKSGYVAQFNALREI